MKANTWKKADFSARLDALAGAKVPDASRPDYARLDWASLPAGLQANLGKTKQQREQEDAVRRLKQDFKLRPGSVIYTIVRHRSASGMYRVIDLYVVRKNTPLCITSLACKATGTRWDNRHRGMSAPGYGLDVCFEAIYNLGCALWPDGFKDPATGERRSDSGYALRKEAL